jgi:ankyrin repeat protein
MAKLLLDHGAAADAQDAHGNTPLSHAVFESRGRGEMIRLLLSFGADKALKNKHGVSPENLARTIANYDVSIFLR